MSQGIGIRYNERGVRLLSLDMNDNKLKINGIAAGIPEETIKPFLESKVSSGENTSITIGLGPGNFLSSSMIREEEMSGKDMKDHLRWEIEQKIISTSEDFSYDFFITDTIGCVFAGRSTLIEKQKSIITASGTTIKNIITDVEPVALYNGSEGCGEIGSDTLMLVSLEAEGISSLVFDRDTLCALESFVILEEDLCASIPGLDSEGMEQSNEDTTERLSEYIMDSMKRLTSIGDNKDKPAPKQLVLSGGGVYIGKLAEIVTYKSGVPTVISDPLKLLLPEIKEDQPELAGMGAAFTTCFGLALRALED